MERTVFLADSHLRGPQDPNQRLLVDFLRSQAGSCRLVLLGDIFEFLAGRNRAAEEAYAEVLEGLAAFSPLEVLEGNHDFDLSPDIPGLAAASIHPGPVMLEFGARRLLAVHGDRSSPRDVGTKLLRRFLQSAPTRFLRDHVLPANWLFRFALGFASLSRWRPWPGRSREAVHSLRQAVKLASACGAEAAVFAHTHRPLLERRDSLVAANPGMAVGGGSYLELAGDSFSLRSFPEGKVLPPGPLRLGKVP